MNNKSNLKVRFNLFNGGYPQNEMNKQSTLQNLFFIQILKTLFKTQAKVAKQRWSEAVAAATKGNAAATKGKTKPLQKRFNLLY